MGKVKKTLSKRKAMTKMAATKKKRETLGNMTLKENSTCAEMAEDEEEAAKLLKDNLTSGEAGSSWAKRQSHLKRKIDAKKNMCEVERRKKRLAAALWLEKPECKKCLHTSSTVKAGEA